MRKKSILCISSILVILVVAAIWYFIPKTFAKGINPDEIDYLSVFDGKTGTGFMVNDPKEIRMIVRTIQNVPMKRAGIFTDDYAQVGYDFSIEAVDKNGKSIMPIIFIKGDDTIYKRPFLYTSDGGICVDFLRELEPDLSMEASILETNIMHGTIIEMKDGSVLVSDGGNAKSSGIQPESVEESACIIEKCQKWLYENESDSIITTITNMDSPMLKILSELPFQGRYLALTEKPGEGPYYEVTFTTTADDMLGPITFLLNQETDIIGLYYRE